MKFFHDVTFLRKAVFSLGTVAVGSSLLHLTIGLRLPGLEPLASALFWGALWRWNVVRKAHPGGIWTFLYLLIILMNISAGLSQILVFY